MAMDQEMMNDKLLAGRRTCAPVPGPFSLSRARNLLAHVRPAHSSSPKPSMSQEGRLFAWGCAIDGRLGLGEASAALCCAPSTIDLVVPDGTKIVSIAAGSAQSLALTGPSPSHLLLVPAPNRLILSISPLILLLVQVQDS